MFRSVTLAAAALALTGAAQAHEITFTALMTGPAESPTNNSPGIGHATVTIDLDTITMHVQADFQGLIGTTSAAHIHGATALPGTGTAGVITTTPVFTAFPLGVTSGVYDRTFDMTLASSYNPAFITANGGISGAFNALVFSLEQGRSYFNIHTSAFPGGEIRGFLVPAPGAAVLFAATGLLAARRRRA